MISLKNVSFVTKLPLLFVAMSAIGIIVAEVGSLRRISADLIAGAKADNHVLASERAAELEAWYAEIVEDMTFIAAAPETVNTINELHHAFHEVGANPTAVLKRLYITNNPNPLGEKHRLDDAGDGSAYSAAHAAHHPMFRAFLETRGYYDIFLFDDEGELIYTVFKEEDFGTDFAEGEYKETALARAFRRAVDSGEEIVFEDFEPYAPSHGAQASFAARTLRGPAGELIGVLAVQMPVGRLHAVAQPAEGAPEGELIRIVGEDRTFRANSLDAEAGASVGSLYDNAAIMEDVAARHVEFTDGEGVERLASFAVAEVGDRTWTVIIEEPMEAVMAPVMAAIRGALLEAAIVLLVLGAIGYFVTRRLIAPLNGAADTIEAIADGDLDTDVAGADAGDEVGRIAKNLVAMREKLKIGKEKADEAIMMSGGFNYATRPLVLVDEDFVVASVNPAFRRFMETYGDQLAEVADVTDPKKLVGRTMDWFHRDEASRRRMLDGIVKPPHVDEFEVGALTIGLKVSPVLDDDGARKGYALEFEEKSGSRFNIGLSGALARSQIVVEYAPDGRIITANAGFCESMGVSPEKVVGMNQADFLPDDERKAADKVWNALADGEFQSGKIRRKALDGRTVWIRGVYAPIRNLHGEVCRIAEVSNDVTVAEERVFEQKAMIEAIGTSQVVVEYAPDGKMIRANHNFCELFGYAESQLSGLNRSALAPKDPAEEEIWRGLRSGKAVSGVYRRLRRDGGEIWTQSSYSPVFDRAGAVTRIVETSNDCTEEQAAKLRAEENRQALAAAQGVVVDALRTGLGSLADGDLGAAINSAFSDDYEALRHDFNAAASRLSDAVEEVVATIASFDGSAGQVSEASDDLARRTESQAASLEEAVAALKEVTNGLKGAASEANRASGLTAEAADNAKSGAEVADRSRQAMNEIQKSSEQISSIISVIDDIAF